MISLLDIFAIAVAMSIDAMCVSLCIGVKYNGFKHYLRLGGAFGLFQFMMPVVGAYTGRLMLSYTDNLKYLAALILFLIAFNMVRDGIKNRECKVYYSDPTKGLPLLILALATSVDALGAGLSLIFWEGGIFTSSAVIGVVCMLFSFAGVYIGGRCERYIGHYAEYFGSAVLALIGLKFIF